MNDKPMRLYCAQATRIFLGLAALLQFTIALLPAQNGSFHVGSDVGIVKEGGVSKLHLRLWADKEAADVRIEIIDTLAESNAKVRSHAVLPKVDAHPQDVKLGLVGARWLGKSGNFKVHIVVTAKDMTSWSGERMISVVAPALDLGKTATAKIRLVRSSPWADVEGTARFRVQVTNQVPMPDLKASAGPLVNKHNGYQAKASVTAIENGKDRAPQTPATICLEVSGGADAGEYESRVFFTSPRLPESKMATLSVTVTDHWWLPLVVIAIGVALAFFVSQIAGRSRPVLVNRIRIDNLRKRLAALDEALPSEADGEISRLRRRLDQAERLNSVDHAKAGTMLSEISKAADALDTPVAGEAHRRGRESTDPETLRKKLLQQDVFIHGVAILVACVTGLLTLYVNKVFGTLGDYCSAFLWGFAIDTSVVGFRQVMAKLNS